jgi:hypothetical protein
MSTITFDTFKFVDRLEKAGVPREQAAALVDAQKEALAEALDNTLATKSDIQSVRADIEAVRADMAKIEARLSGELNLVKWMLGVVIAIAIANFAKQFL